MSDPARPSAVERLREARARVKLAEARHQLVRLRRRTKKLRESNLLWDWVNPYSQLLDQLRTDDGRLFLAPSTVSDRRYGANWPWWRTWQEHAILRAQSRFLVVESDLAAGALSGLASYVVADGYTYRVTARKGRKPPPALVDAVQQEVDDHLKRNGWAALELELFKRSRRDGEFFLRHFPLDDGTTDVRVVEPEQVLDDPDLPLEIGSFGVENAPGDVSRHVAYHVCYEGDPTQGERVETGTLLHLRCNVDCTIKRGMPDFVYATHDALRSAGRCIQAMVESATVQASVAEIRQHEVNTRSQVQEFQDDEADYQTRNPATGDLVNNRRITPGEVRDIPKGFSYVPPPFSQGGPVWIQTTQASLRRAGVKWNAPEWLVSADASNNNYASSLTAEAPFTRRCQRWQRVYREAYGTSTWSAVRTAAEAGRIRAEGRTWSWEEVRRECDLQVEAPSLVIRDKVQEAQANSIKSQAGILSPQTWSQQEGLDYDQEQQQISEHNERTGGQGEDLPLSSEGAEGQPPAEEGAGEGDPLSSLLGTPPPDVEDGPSAPAEGDGLGGQAGGGADSLRATVGGSQAIAALQRSYYAGELPRSAAVANARIVFGFGADEAEQLFPEEAPQKLVPEEGRPTETIEEAVFRERIAARAVRGARELYEACVPNRVGKGMHDDRTGHPCSAGGQAEKAKRDRARDQQRAADSQAGGPGHEVAAAFRGAIDAAMGAGGAVKERAVALWDRFSEWTKGKVERSPKAVRWTARAAAWTVHAIEVTGQATQGFVQGLATELVTERGYSAEDAERVSNVARTIDAISSWTANVPAAHHALHVAAHIGGLGGFAISKLAFFVPVASLAYVGYAAAASVVEGNPLATIRAARNVIRNGLTHGIDMHAHGPKAARESVEGQGDARPTREQVERLVEGIAEGGDWYAALLAAAIDELHDLGAALDAADRAVAERPAAPLSEASPPAEPYWRAILRESALLGAGFTGTKQVMVRGKPQTWYYVDGRRVAAPNKEDKGKPRRAPRTKPDRPTVEDIEARIEALKANPGRLTPASAADLAIDILGLTARERDAWKKRAGYKASGVKAEQARKLARQVIADVLAGDADDLRKIKGGKKDDASRGSRVEGPGGPSPETGRRVEAPAGRPDGEGPGGGGDAGTQPLSAAVAGSVPSREQAERVAVDARRVNEKLDRFERLFRANGNDRAAGLMGMLRDHVNAVGVESALLSLGEDRGAGDGSEVGYTEARYWSDSMGEFTEAYLGRHGIVPAQLAGTGSKIVSPFTTKYAELTPDFEPAETPYQTKLDEAKDLPGLEASEDISVIMGKKTTHLTDEVYAKMDERFGKGQWIVKTYGDDAFAGQGIFFPQRAAAIAQSARDTIWNAGSALSQYGFQLARDPDSGKVAGIVHSSGDLYAFGSPEYEQTIDGDARQWAEKAREAADHEKGMALPNGGEQFMVQPAFPVVGVSEEERAAGKTIVSGEGRVHVVVRNGKAEVIPHSTWIKGAHLPIVFEDDETRAMAQAAQEAIDKLPEKARAGQLYAPDVVKTANGYKVVELNAAVDEGGSGYLWDNPFIIDAYVSHLSGRSPGHVRFIRNLLTQRKKGK